MEQQPTTQKGNLSAETINLNNLEEIELWEKYHEKNPNKTKEYWMKMRQFAKNVADPEVRNFFAENFVVEIETPDLDSLENARRAQLN